MYGQPSILIWHANTIIILILVEFIYFMQISILSLFAISICIMVCVTQTAECTLKGTGKTLSF